MTRPPSDFNAVLQVDPIKLGSTLLRSLQLLKY
jgi:hypothetical protein